MRKKVKLLFGMLLGIIHAHCQLLMNYKSSSEPKFKTIDATIAPVVTGNNKMVSLVSIGYKQSFSKNWMYEVGVSTMEKIYPTAVSFDLRRNHISSCQSITKFLSIKKTRTSFSISNYSCWDLITARQARQIYSVAGNRVGNKGSEVSLILENWTDRVGKLFALADLSMHPEKYRFQTILVRYSGPTKRKLVPYMETLIGRYYSYPRYAFRLGQRLNLSSHLKLQVDMEYNRVGKQSLAEGYLTRLQSEWRPIKNLTAGLYALNNSFLKLTAIMGSLGYIKNNHNIKIEYRDLRNADLKIVESSSPLFSSRVLFQYQFQF